MNRRVYCSVLRWVRGDNDITLTIEWTRLGSDPEIKCDMRKLNGWPEQISDQGGVHRLSATDSVHPVTQCMFRITWISQQLSDYQTIGLGSVSVSDWSYISIQSTEYSQTDHLRASHPHQPRGSVHLHWYSPRLSPHWNARRRRPGAESTLHHLHSRDQEVTSRARLIVKFTSH